MMKENINMHLSTLKEMLLDERKIITYVSLSRDLCIHVNECKHLLEKLVEDIRSKDTNMVLNISYLISGLLDHNKAETTVCNEAQLSEVSSKFKTIFYQHLYSVGVGAPSTDNVVFTSINKFEDFSLCRGLIKSNSCTKRLATEIGKLKAHSQDVILKGNQPDLSSKKKINEENKKDDTTGANTLNNAQHVKSEPVNKSDVQSPKKVMSNGMVEKNNHKPVNNKTQKGIAGFFNKGAGTSKKSTKDNDVKNPVKAEKIVDNIIKSEKMEIDQSTKSEKIDVDQDSNNKVRENGNHEKNISKDKSSNVSLNKIKKSAVVEKKRKRVLHVSDSESEDEENDPFVKEPVKVEPESDDEIPPTPANNAVKITSGIVNPKKKRKIVDKTYTDEDGYILTRKEEVYESCSENEEEHSKENVQVSKKPTLEVSPKEKKNITKNRKKINSPVKGKQSTINSFFKKK